MPIDSTKGLPSFSEMYNAYKNKGGLGQALQGGIDAFNTAKSEASKENLQAAEAEKHRADAKKAAEPKAAGVVRIDQITDPAEKSALAQYATPNEQGILVVPIATYNAITHRDQGQQTVDLKNQLAQQAAKHNQDLAERDQKLAKIAEEKAALQASLGPKVQQTTAAHDLANSAATVESPTLLQRGASFVKEAVTGKPLASVLAERQGEAARAKLAELSGAGPQPGEPLPKGPVMPNPVDEATGNVYNSKILTVNSTEEYNKLPPGTRYQDSYGNIATKPGTKRK